MKRRGSSLVLSLLLIGLLMMMGLAFLGQHGAGRQSSTRFAQSLQAKQLARAGLEEVRARLATDLNYPPQPQAWSLPYTSTEDVLDNDGITLLGYHTVTVDASLMAAPYGVLRVTSVGTVGDHQVALAVHTLYAEIDVYPRNRSNPAQVNPMLYRILSYQDWGGL